ncbi:MAG: DUF1592 domain-containing protein [Acidobacteria bacterium]|nr:DUF1592 domain-containing protein [Acidobacteriota bacterium]
MNTSRTPFRPPTLLTRILLGSTAAVFIGVVSFHVSAEPAHRVRPIPLRPAAMQQSLPTAALSPSSQASASDRHQAMVDRYCVTCHNDRLKTAGLVLSRSAVDLANPQAHARVLEKVITKLRGRAMPPAGAPRPAAGELETFTAYLETSIDRAAGRSPNPGRTAAVHRLNRAEYTNAIRDLLAVDIDATSLLPADDASYGFDNIGDVLSVSPALMESYMSAARKISRLAVGTPTMLPVSEKYDLPRYLMQYDRMSEDLPFGTRGGTAIRHYFPLDAEYDIKIRLQRNAKTDIVGLEKLRPLDIRIDGAKVHSFAVGGIKVDQSANFFERGPVDGNADPLHDFDETLNIRIPVKAGVRSVGVAYLGATSEPERPWQPRATDYGYTQDILYGNYDTDSAVASVTIAGPYGTAALGETASRQRVFVCRPSSNQNDQSCARKILGSLARLAYRRPVNDRDLQPLLRIYQEALVEGGFEEGIQAGLHRILIDPQFLFRIQRDPAGAASDAYRVSDLELASRLSFFLWSSIPDTQLLDVAERGRLKDAAVFEQQARRMLADPRSKALVSNFFGQWLYLRNVHKVWPSPDFFPDFDQNLRDGFQEETELFLETMLREDRPVPELLDADFTFLNERLAQHYGIRNIYGSHFRRVRVTDENRRGLLGHGSILTLTSYANRTAPTIRGKWLLENIIGTPPPPPPPSVPSLQERRQDDGKLLTMRQQLEAHRANPACATCHRAMDPLGFALENFDATGKWRTVDQDGETPIDASGALPDGTAFEGPTALRHLLMKRPEQLVTTVTEKLLTYALGRGVEYYDAPAIRSIIRDAAPSNYRWSSIILGIVKSVPFQMRAAAAVAPVASH